MKTKYFLLGFLLLSSYTANAQILDSLGTLGIQGVLTRQSVSQVGQGLSLLKQNQILQDLVQTVTQIRTTYINGYTGVNLASVYGQPFKDISWSIGPKGAKQFYIELNGIDQSACQKLVSSMTDAQEIEVNHVVGTSRQCKNNNTLKFIFN